LESWNTKVYARPRPRLDVIHVTVQYLQRWAASLNYAPSYFLLKLLAAMVSATVESTNDARLTDTGGVGYALTWSCKNAMHRTSRVCVVSSFRL